MAGIVGGKRYCSCSHKEFTWQHWQSSGEIRNVLTDCGVGRTYEVTTNRSLYLVLESVSMKDNTWGGLPTLEVIRRAKPATTAAKRTSILQKFLSGA